MAWCVNSHHPHPHYYHVVEPGQISLTLSLHIRRYHTLLPVGLLGLLLCQHRAIVGKFLLVKPTLAQPCEKIHWNQYLWFNLYFANGVPHVLFVLFGWFQRVYVSGRTAVVSWFIAWKICPICLLSFLRTPCLAFPLKVFQHRCGASKQ